MTVTTQARAGREIGVERSTRGAFWLAGGLVGIALVARLAPLFDAGGRLLRQFPTEDGYLMLTIARNMALGKGITVSDGLIATNGAQPLATLLWAGVFWLTGGDRRLGVLGVQVLSLALACVTAWLLFGLARSLLGALRHGTSAAFLLTAAWLASPMVVVHSMNCLETGLYGLVVVCVARVFAGSPQAAPWSPGRCLAVGVLLGLAFWTRNDAMFLILAACLVHVGWAFVDPAKPLARRIGETLAFGATSVVTAAPWLVFNLLRFGSIVPISGQSEALEGRFALNLWRVPGTVFEYATWFLPVPGSVEQAPWVLAGAALVCLAVTALAARAIRDGSPIARAIACLGAIYGVCLLLFYGLFFGAGYFFSRYLFPLSPFLALLTGAVLRRAWELAEERGWRLAPAAAGALLLVFAAGLDLRLYRKGTEHMHFQVVDWVQAHVPDDAWVGAPQSGTLGFFHDRTINLDGKVNPEALRARVRDHETLNYVLGKREIEYLADWEGLASWVQDPRMAAHFDLLVHDPEQNLAVLRRRDHAGPG